MDQAGRQQEADTRTQAMLRCLHETLAVCRRAAFRGRPLSRSNARRLLTRELHDRGIDVDDFNRATPKRIDPPTDFHLIPDNGDTHG